MTNITCGVSLGAAFLTRICIPYYTHTPLRQAVVFNAVDLLVIAVGHKILEKFHTDKLHCGACLGAASVASITAFVVTTAFAGRINPRVAAALSAAFFVIHRIPMLLLDASGKAEPHSRR